MFTKYGIKQEDDDGSKKEMRKKDGSSKTESRFLTSNLTSSPLK